MSGRSSFSRTDIAVIRELLREVRNADPARQKTIRAKMRNLGFYITDYATDQQGFTASDLDEMIARGTITVTES